MLLSLQSLNLLADGASSSKTYSVTFTRLALYGGARPLYGSFAGKTQAVSSTFFQEYALTGRFDIDYPLTGRFDTDNAITGRFDIDYPITGRLD